MSSSNTAITFGDRNAGFQVGQSYAPINAEIHLSPGRTAHLLNDRCVHDADANVDLALERPETPPLPSSNVPFRRDSDFIERGDLLDQLHNRLSLSAARLALAGLGGVGKSQLAIEYTHRLRHRSPDTWVLWIHASNAARFEQSVREITDLIKLNGRNDQSADILRLFSTWLREEGKRSWLVVLDNADDVDFLLRPPNSGAGERSTNQSGARTLFNIIPICDHGSMLITSRSKTSALRLVEDRDILTVGPMEEDDATSLLARKLDTELPNEHDTHSSLRDLAEALEYMPLAITQAAAYIRRKRPRCSVEQYLALLRQSDISKSSLLDRDDGDLRRDGEAKNSIMVTWHISFEHVNRTRKSAGDLLSLMSFFDRQAIPEYLLRNAKLGANPDEDALLSTEEIWQSLTDSFTPIPYNDGQPRLEWDAEFEDDVEMLEGYCFTSLSKDGSAFDMHRLVQMAMQQWLQHSGRLAAWRAVFIDRLFSAFPWGQYESWGGCQMLFPHVRAALTKTPSERRSLIQWAEVLTRAQTYMMQRGQWTDAETLGEQALDMRKAVLGEKQQNTIASMTNLATCYQRQGRDDAAEELEARVLEISKEVLGEKHPYTLTSMNNLALIRGHLGRLHAAEELNVQALELLKEVQGSDHPDTLFSMSNLASTYAHQSRFKAAEELEIQVLDLRKEAFGEKHPDTLASMANLASMYWASGQLDAAENLELQVLHFRKEVLGDRHPDTLESMANLARTLKAQSHDESAIRLMLESAKVSSQILGANHKQTKRRWELVNEWTSEGAEHEPSTE